MTAPSSPPILVTGGAGFIGSNFIRVWLARETAAHGAPAEAAATACTQATVAAKQVAAETHQLSGAIGFTKEYPLHVFTTRAQGLTLELGGLEAHARSIDVRMSPR